MANIRALMKIALLNDNMQTVKKAQINNGIWNDVNHAIEAARRKWDDIDPEYKPIIASLAGSGIGAGTGALAGKLLGFGAGNGALAGLGLGAIGGGASAVDWNAILKAFRDESGKEKKGNGSQSSSASQASLESGEILPEKNKKVRTGSLINVR